MFMFESAVNNINWVVIKRGTYGPFRYFLIFPFFTNKKWFFALFIMLLWQGVGFLNRTGAEIGY